MPLFVVLEEGLELTAELEAHIARRIRDDCSPRHVPDEIDAVAEIPRTLSGKLLEAAIRWPTPPRSTPSSSWPRGSERATPRRTALSERL